MYPSYKYRPKKRNSSSSSATNLPPSPPSSNSSLGLQDDPETTEFCRVRSLGPDGEGGTDDDLLWVIYLDGHISEKDGGSD